MFRQRTVSDAAVAAVVLSALLCAAALTLTGCVVAPLGPAPAYGAAPAYGGAPAYESYGEVVGVPPPAPRAEYYGVAPAVGSVWISGYWNWGGGRYAWSPGYWSAPRPGYHWVPHRWVPYGHGWRLGRGHWDRGG